MQIGLLGRVFTVFAGFLACASLSGCAGHSRYDEAWFTSGRLLYENRKENSNSYIVDATTDTLLAHAINNGPDHNPVYSDNPQNKSFHLKSLNLSTNDKLYLVYGINADNGNECPSPDNPFVVQFNNTNQSWMVLDSTTGSNILLASG
ncbi:MAG TPA: hypothetical protein VME24_02410, partial [Alphaproteobacteria bacterium]|nr:hypothetical protein [Alphaproteobacteria bacterium]